MPILCNLVGIRIWRLLLRNPFPMDNWNCENNAGEYSQRDILMLNLEVEKVPYSFKCQGKTYDFAP